ncbi:alpha/beta hydrolase [Candidatus Gracilibacteria bacterium]|nr:alpha/beta hydrolase [Candidatus Gracilibacteria bacterium]
MTVDNKNLAYRYIPSSASGNVRGNAIFIHGFAAWGKTWFDQELQFSESGFDVYSLDLPPFGMTDVYDDAYFSRTKQAEIINAFIDQKQLSDIVLVAHSYGGKAALEAYMKQPESYTGMVLLDVALGFPRDPNYTFTQPTGGAGYIFTHKLPRDLLMRFVMTNTFIGTMALKSFLHDGDSLTNERLAIYKTPFTIQRKGEYVGDWLSYISTHEEGGFSLDASRYKNITIPTLLIWGKQDTITPIEQGRELHTMIPGSELVELENVNHIPQIEDRENVRKFIEKFLLQFPN